MTNINRSIETFHSDRLVVCARKHWRRAGYFVGNQIGPIIPVMIYDAEKAQVLSIRLLELGVYVIGFFYPVVPEARRASVCK